MKLEFISNTGSYLEHKGIVFGMDLWLTQGAFEGSWYHYPPLRPTSHKPEDCRFVYISHIHPDHCDFNTLRRCASGTTFIVPNYFNDLLARKLRAFGFTKIVSMAPGSEAELMPGLRIRLFPQFINNLFHVAAFGNLIDSALAIQWDDRVILNCNDNYLDAKWAKQLAALYPKLDLLLAPHSASGPYPASFRNLSAQEKRAESKRLQTRYIRHFADMAALLKPRLAVPCAAEYVVVGELSDKNPNIGLAEARDAVSEVRRRRLPGVKAVQLDCGSILDVDTGKRSGLAVRRLSERHKRRFIDEHRDAPFAYQWEDSFSEADIESLFHRARANLWSKQQRVGFARAYNLYLTIDGAQTYHFDFASAESIRTDSEDRVGPYLECFLSRQLFYQILTRKAHWNNAEGGLHIDFYRKPNSYIPEVFTLLSFLHVPESAPAKIPLVPAGR